MMNQQKLIKAKQIKKENLSVIYKDPTDNQFYEKFDDGKVVNITEEIPFDIPNNWAWIRLGNISTYAHTKNKINSKNADPEMWLLDMEDIAKRIKEAPVACRCMGVLDRNEHRMGIIGCDSEYLSRSGGTGRKRVGTYCRCCDHACDQPQLCLFDELLSGSGRCLQLCTGNVRL